MIKVSELLSKQLICLSNASVAGTISNIVFDEKLTRGKLLQLLNDDDDTPEVKYVELKRVSSLSEDAGVVKNEECIRNEWDVTPGAPNPINCLGFNQDGKALGKVRDVFLEGVSVVKIVLDEAEFTPKELLSYSDSMLIFNDTGKPIKLTHQKPKVPPPESGNTTVRVHSFNDSVAPAANASESGAAESAGLFDAGFTDAPQTEKVDVPAKIPRANTQVLRSPAVSETGYKFLLGKPVHTDIVGLDGRVLIRAGTVVNEEVIAAARDNGKLVQLALHAY